MNLSAASVSLILLALGLYGLSTSHALRARLRRRHALLAAAVVVAVIGHVGLVRTSPDGGLVLRAPPPHLHEFFHYYLGTKYFDVLGYTGLYDATVLADLEDEPERFQASAPMRDLRTNAPMLRGAAIGRAREVKARFRPERWEAFKRDLALIRDAVPADLWDLRGYVQDHGYNGTPLVTALLGSLARQPLLSTRDFVDTIRWLDLELLVLAGAAVAGILGPAVGLGFLVVTFANPLDDFAFVGGAYLRYGYFLALVGAIVALRQRRPAIAGTCFALACGLRIFPVVLYGTLVLHALLQTDRWARLRAGRRIHIAFGLTSVAILAVSGSIATPTGRTAWVDFARNLTVHATTPSANLVGVQTPFAYAPAKDRHTDPAEVHRETPARAFDWATETRRLLDERFTYRLAAGILLAAAALVALRRVTEIEFVLPGLLLLFAVQPLSHYYWTILSLIPLALPARRSLLLGLTGTLAVLALLAAPGPLDARLDLRFALVSIVLGVFLVAASWRTVRRPLAGACAVALATFGCAEPPGPPTIEGDRYHSRALGFTVDKPTRWHFAPVTSLRRDTEERVRERKELWELLEMKTLGPLVVASPAADPQEGRDPMFRVYVIPSRPRETASGLAILASIATTKAVTTFAHNRSGKPGFEIASEAVEATLGEREGAVIELRYGIPREDGDPLPVRERLGLVRRDHEFWYFSVSIPEPVDPETEAQLAGMLADMRLDD